MVAAVCYIIGGCMCCIIGGCMCDIHGVPYIPEQVHADAMHRVAPAVIIAHVLVHQHALGRVGDVGIDGHSAVANGDEGVEQVVGEVVVGGKGVAHGGDAEWMVAAGELGNVIELQVGGWTPCALWDLDQGGG